MVQLDWVLDNMSLHPPSKCRVVVRKRSEAHTRSPKTATIAIDEVVDHDVKGITEPECMVVVLTQTTPRKISAYLSTLKYGSKQSACSVPGQKLLKWLLKYVEHGFVSHVAVEDASQTNIGGTKVWLGLFRKFCTGQTWYEQYGFLPKDQYDRWAFQRSFDVVRRARIKDVRSFIWLIIQPFIRLKRKNTNELLDNVKFVEYSRSNKKHVKSMTRVIDACHEPLSCLAFEPVSRDTLMDVLEDMNKQRFHSLWRFVQWTGLSETDVCISEDTCALKEQLKNKAPTKCFSSLAPNRHVLDRIMTSTGSVDEKSDVKTYVHTLHAVLILFNELGILNTPPDNDYIFERNNKTPMRLTSRCRSPLRCT